MRGKIFAAHDDSDGLQCKGAKIVFFEQSGHLPAFEEPAKYRSVLESFLNDR